MMVNELLNLVMPMAAEWAGLNSEGALHLVVADGNITDEYINFCLWKTEGITEIERSFAARLLQWPEEMRAMMFALSKCEDIAMANSMERSQR